MDSLILLRPGWLLAEPPDPPVTGMAVLVRGGAIEAVLEAHTPVADARVVELAGATLLPGLIDAHVHLTMCGCCTPRQTMLGEDNDMLLLRAAENARRALHAGITTLRDCGDRDGITFTLREALNRGILDGPRLLLSGPPLTTPRGHCYFMRGEVEGRDHIARRIGELADRGADLIKVMATGGGLTPGTDSLVLQFPPEDLSFIVEQATHYGLPVAAHAHSAGAIEACVEAGVQTIEHATFAQPATFARLRERGTVVTPTNVPARIAVAEGRTLGLARELGITSADFLEGRRRVVRELYGATVRVIAGSDAGATRVPFTALTGEIAALADAGFSQLEAIAAATTHAASALGISDTGRIVAGCRADLIAVQDLQKLDDPLLVMSNGRIVRQPA